MARRNASYQQLFLESLDGLGKTALATGQAVGQHRRAEAENTRQEAESKARLGLIDEQKRGAKTAADKDAFDYDKMLRQGNLEKSLQASMAEQSKVHEGRATMYKDQPATAVDFQGAKKANRDTRQADMALWNFANPDKPKTADALAQMREQDQQVKDMEVEGKTFDLGEKEAKATRDQAAHASAMKTDEAQRTLLGAQAGKATRDANAPPKPNELPIDVRSEVQALSGKTAGKKAIANQLDNDLKQMRKAMGLDEAGNPIPGETPNEDLAYSYAQNMLKTMNSKEGADAVGIDEAKRSAGLLEYNVADVRAGLGMKPGNFHGRDIPGFMKQVESNIAGIRGAVNANQGEVDSLMGRQPADGNAPSAGAPKAGHVEDGYRFKGGNPADPNNWEKT